MEAKLREFFKQDRFAARAGIELVAVKPGYAVARMEITRDHYNAAGLVQGGAIFTLADLAFGAAANASGQVTVGLNSHISFFKPAEGRFLTAEAKEISAGKKITGYSVDIFNESRELIARVASTGYRKNEQINFSKNEGVGKTV
ncbi:MAG: PaaI family thioesterase [Heliobacteriaceae bacterium]|nr:PaaI family thioesterase [Heliobacteriaceae bacterium]